MADGLLIANYCLLQRSDAIGHVAERNYRPIKTCSVSPLTRPQQQSIDKKNINNRKKSTN